MRRRGDVGPAPLRRAEEDVADDAQDVGAPLVRRDELLDLVAEEEQADLVAVADGGEGEDAGDLGGQFALALVARAEFAGGADVDGEHDGQFPLLAQLLDEGCAGAGRDVPVDQPDFVAGTVFADLVEVHAAALEDGVVFARERFGDEAARA